MLFLCFCSGYPDCNGCSDLFREFYVDQNNCFQRFEISCEHYFKHFVTIAFFSNLCFGFFFAECVNGSFKSDIWTAILQVKRISEMTHKPCQYRQPILQLLISTHSHRFFLLRPIFLSRIHLATVISLICFYL